MLQFHIARKRRIIRSPVVIINYAFIAWGKVYSLTLFALRRRKDHADHTVPAPGERGVSNNEHDH